MRKISSPQSMFAPRDCCFWEEIGLLKRSLFTIIAAPAYEKGAAHKNLKPLSWQGGR